MEDLLDFQQGMNVASSLLEARLEVDEEALAAVAGVDTSGVARGDQSILRP